MPVQSMASRLTNGTVGLKMNSWPVGPDVTGNKNGLWWGCYTRASPFAVRIDAPSGLTSAATSPTVKRRKKKCSVGCCVSFQ